MALSESSNVGGVPPHTQPLSHSLHGFQQNIYSKSLSSWERSSNFGGEANGKKTRRDTSDFSPRLQSRVKMFWGKRIRGDVCRNGSSVDMASAAHAEASCLHMVVIVGFAAEAWERKNKRIQTYKHIFVILRPGCTVISLIGPKSLLKAEYHTSFVKI